MDQHPIPQDVTGFQFKLIGTMTVKQFGYVASGVIMAVILYYAPFEGAFAILMKLILIPLLGGGGVVVAFVPIDGRPIDLMATNFAKALFSPNQYVYRRHGHKFSFSTVSLSKPVAPATTTDKDGKVTTQPTHQSPQEQIDEKEEKLRAYLSNSQGGVKNDLDKKEAAFLKTLSIPSPHAARPAATAPVAVAKPAIAKPTPAVVSAPAPQPIAKPALATPPKPDPVQAAAPTPQPTVKPKPSAEEDAALAQKEKQLQEQLAAAKQEEDKTQAPDAHQKVSTLQKQVEEIHAQKLKLEQELAALQNQLATHKTASATPQAAPAPKPATPTTPKPATAQPAPNTPTQDPSHVRTIPQGVTKKAGLPRVSDTPNVVVGIVKDSRGNILSNILVEVKDKDENPVRAFKTNALGQFASATPLSPGVYTMELEDPKKLHKFDVIQITANNQILLPIEVISHDAREELHKQLFAQ